MNITFSVLCSVEVTHAYYGGRCPDVAFVIPSDSGASLRRGRLIVKPFDGRSRWRSRTSSLIRHRRSNW